jgi:NAD(P)-dependent dehydrogenase (short-subunit alcohol dehydrogenase family)
MKHELVQMRKQGSGAIVNCSSIGRLVGRALIAAYHGTKHGVIGLTAARRLNTPRAASALMLSASARSTRRWYRRCWTAGCWRWTICCVTCR